METRSDNLKKIPVASKKRNPIIEAGLKKKVAAASLERQLTSLNKKKELPQLTPLHRLQRFKAIRDRNLKSKGFKTSLEFKLKKMEEVSSSPSDNVELEQKKIKKTEELVTATTTTVEKSTVKGTFEKVEEVSSSNSIENSGKEEESIDYGSGMENGHDEKSIPNEENCMSSRLKGINDEDQTTEDSQALDKEQVMSKDESQVKIPVEEPTIENNVETHTETEDVSKGYVENMTENDAVSSISSHQAVTNSTPGPTDDEEEVEIIESKPEYEINSGEKNLESSKQEEKELLAEKLFTSKAIVERSSNRCLSNYSVASSYKSSYSNVSRIYGRRPVRHLSASRKRKLEDESVRNYDYKRTSSPSLPSPRWRFIPSSMNFWTPRTTPFVFPAPTPINSLNDSMTVNVDDDTIRSSMEDSDLFSDADEFAPQPVKKSRWGCAIM